MLVAIFKFHLILKNSFSPSKGTRTLQNREESRRIVKSRQRRLIIFSYWKDIKFPTNNRAIQSASKNAIAGALT